ncbi:MAG: Rrf2 family transcriptional regulator [Phycisphaeraceae bacterium]|nr:MAG: Rrf2 family transcriptional regulator [Phycisphaeraceae bacterium]
MISQTIEYALRAMIHLAGLEAGSSVNSETIAEATRVPQGYLSKIMRDLVVAGLVNSRRGPNGGFVLAVPAETISMLDVVNAVDPFRRITKCPLGKPAHLALCPLHQRMDDAMASVEAEFRRTTLAEVLESGRAIKPGCRVLMTPTRSAVARPGKTPNA